MTIEYTLKGPRRELLFDPKTKSFHESDRDFYEMLPEDIKARVVSDQRSTKLIEMLRVSGFAVTEAKPKSSLTPA